MQTLIINILRFESTSFIFRLINSLILKPHEYKRYDHTFIYTNFVYIIFLYPEFNFAHLLFAGRQPFKFIYIQSFVFLMSNLMSFSNLITNCSSEIRDILFHSKTVCYINPELLYKFIFCFQKNPGELDGTPRNFATLGKLNSPFI